MKRIRWIGRSAKNIANQREKAMRQDQAEAMAEWVARRFRAVGWRIFAPHEDRNRWEFRDGWIDVREYDGHGVLIEHSIFNTHTATPRRVALDDAPTRWPWLGYGRIG